MTPDLTITRQDQLDSLRRRRGSPRVRVSLAPSLGGSDARRAWLERRINRSLAACGCNEGTVAGLLYIGALTALALRGALSMGTKGWLLAVAGFVVSLVLGKATGLLLARWRLRRAVRAVHALARRHPRMA